MGTTPAMQTRSAPATRLPGRLADRHRRAGLVGPTRGVARRHHAVAIFLPGHHPDGRAHRDRIGARPRCRFRTLESGDGLVRGGASTTYAIVSAVIYQALLSGNLQATSSLLEHAVVPALAVIDWLAFGPAGAAAGRARQAWWTPLTWLILPICYLGIYYIVRDRNGRPLYPFLD